MRRRNRLSFTAPPSPYLNLKHTGKSNFQRNNPSCSVVCTTDEPKKSRPFLGAQLIPHQCHTQELTHDHLARGIPRDPSAIPYRTVRGSAALHPRELLPRRPPGTGQELEDSGPRSSPNRTSFPANRGRPRTSVS